MSIENIVKFAEEKIKKFIPDIVDEKAFPESKLETPKIEPNDTSSEKPDIFKEVKKKLEAF